MRVHGVGPESHRDTARRLQKLAERYHNVYRTLAALVHQQGGTVTVNGDSFDELPENAGLDVTTDADTGTTTLRLVAGRVTPDPSNPHTKH